MNREIAIAALSFLLGVVTTLFFQHFAIVPRHAADADTTVSDATKTKTVMPKKFDLLGVSVGMPGSVVSKLAGCTEDSWTQPEEDGSPRIECNSGSGALAVKFTKKTISAYDIVLTTRTKMLDSEFKEYVEHTFGVGDQNLIACDSDFTSNKCWRLTDSTVLGINAFSKEIELYDKAIYLRDRGSITVPKI